MYSSEFHSHRLLLLVGVTVFVGVDGRSLGNELSALLRVMWSGKWAVVSPHQMLKAVWAKMPFFKGYTQHDAQEFLRSSTVGKKTLNYVLISHIIIPSVL